VGDEGRGASWELPRLEAQATASQLRKGDEGKVDRFGQG
jgi:hypothetical protein